MSFAGKVWKLLVGIKDGLVLIFMLLFFALLYAVLTSRPSPGQVREGALLIALDGAVVEEPSAIDPVELLLSGTLPAGEHSVRDVTRALDAAATDDRVKAVVLDLSRFTGGGQVHMQAIGDALDRVRAAKKPVLTYALAYGDDALLLSAHATEVWVDPMGGAIPTGPGGENLYYAGLFEQFAVKAHVYRVGTYKSAVEPFMLSGMSPEARENAQQLYGALWSEWQANVKRARPKAQIERVLRDPVAWLATSRGDTAKAAVEAGLADKIGDGVAFGKRVAEIVGEDRWSSVPGAFAATELKPWLAANPAPRGGKAIGVVTIAGEISDGQAGPGEAGGERIAALLDDALERDFAALVVRVDSPGGTILGSELIRRAILRHKEKGIPVAVSMANLAASGGYWVATPGDRIFAEPETVTGSIGVFGVVPSFEGTLGRYGVTTDGVTTTPLSGQPDLLAGFTPETDAVLQATVEDAYAKFLGIVAQSRKKTPQAVDTIAQGRVWDGGTARQLGLVDEFGGMQDALEWAAKAAKIGGDDWHAVYLETPVDPYTSLIEQLVLGDSARESPAEARDLFGLLTARERGLGTRLVGDLERLFGSSGIQAYCLECPVQPARTSTKAPLGLWQTLGNLLGV
jgi:protease-4